MAKKQKNGSIITLFLLLSMLLSNFVNAVPSFAALTQEDFCYQQGGIWSPVSGCRKAERVSVRMVPSDCERANGTVNADGTCTMFTYKYLWGGENGISGSAEPTVIQKMVDNASECQGRILNRDNATGKFICEETVSDGSAGGGGINYPGNIDGDYSRPAHPGREPTENENPDPGSSDVTTDAGISAVPGNGYSSTGGVKTEPEQLETAVLDCEGEDGIFCVLNTALTVLTWGVGIAATVGIVLTGIQYTTSRDNAEQLTKAKRRLIAIIIGLLIYAMMWGILNWLLPGGLF